MSFDPTQTIEEVCAWQDDENGASHTDCGGIWECYDSTPPENGMKYCPYCGKLMAWCSYSEPEDDDEEEDTDPYEGDGLGIWRHNL